MYTERCIKNDVYKTIYTKHVYKTMCTKQCI